MVTTPSLIGRVTGLLMEDGEKSAFGFPEEVIQFFEECCAGEDHDVIAG